MKVKADAVIQQKKKYQLEFEIKASPRILYPYISTANGLEGWFAEKCNTRDNVNFIFEWEGTTEKAKLISRKENQSARFKWIEDGNSNAKEDSYFEMEIQQDEITSDVALIVTDFSTDEDKEEDVMIWESQVHELMHIIGS